MRQLALKDDDVKLAAARPETLHAIQVAMTVCQSHNQVLVVTSIADGQHSPKSLHRFGLAFDFRTSGMDKPTLQRFAVDLQSSLGSAYDVVIEDNPPHGHVEYDP